MIKAVLYNPNKLPWEKIKEEIIDVETEAFKEKAFSDEELAEDFQNEKNVVVLLKDTHKIIGFTYAKPAEVFTKENIPEKEKTAWVCDTIIKKEFRGKKLVGNMSDLLERELKKRDYKYIARNPAVANNYAQNISNIYRDRIVQQEGPTDSEWGPQMFFRIKL
jgi:ribosomal protein S18 acetylase RimI-like enzyme